MSAYSNVRTLMYPIVAQAYVPTLNTSISSKKHRQKQTKNTVICRVHCFWINEQIC